MHDIAALRALYEGSPVGLAVWDADMRYRGINPRLAEINGIGRREHIGRTPSELLGDIGVRAEETMRGVLETGEPAADIPFAGETPAAPGVQRHWRASFFVIDGGVGGVVTEVTREVEAQREAETARAAAEVIARAGQAVAASMRPDRVLAELLHAAVPALADFCTIHLSRGDGSLELIAAAHADPALEARVRELAGFAWKDGGGPGGVVRTGETRIYDDVRGLSQPLVAELQARSAVVLPLAARGVVLGALTLVMGPSGRRYDASLIELVGSLAGGAGLALDNARLFAEQREVSRAVQRTLLPASLPEIPGVELAARYRAAGRSNAVGGDFYDVVDDSEQWAFTIGDVVGKGPEAAAITAVVRATLQAAVLRGDDAEASLRLVDEALRRRPANQFCTAVHGRISPPGDDGVVAVDLLVAGHPPPFVVRGAGTLEVVEAPGTLLGITPDPAFGAASIRLEPGDALLLYTDGATELRGADRFRGERVLRDTVLGVAGQPLSRVLETIEHEVLVLGGGELRDDLALLAIGAVRRGAQ
jgi:hypothetical protein